MSLEKYIPDLLRREKLFSHPLISVRKDVVRLESGADQEYLVLEYHSAVAVVGLTPDNQIILVKIPRYPVGEYLWELPGGRVDRQESPIECAKRELVEETGWEAETLEPLITFYPESSFSTEQLHLFIARKLKFTGKSIPEADGAHRVTTFPFETALSMICEGKIKSSWSIIGLQTAKLLDLVGREE